MKYYPVNKWKSVKTAVRFAFVYDTFDEAKQHGLFCQDKYGDQEHLGVVEATTYQECQDLAGALVNQSN